MRFFPRRLRRLSVGLLLVVGSVVAGWATTSVPPIGVGSAAAATVPGLATPMTPSAAVREPVVTPVPASLGIHGQPFDASQLPLAADGYSESEFYLSGLTKTYAEAGTWTSNGVWPTTVTRVADPYTSRILVRRPTDPAKFSGVVVVEWLCDSNVFEVDSEWAEAYRQIIADGDAWVGVSAQSLGAIGLKLWDPVRYAPISLYDDSQSYDVFSQAGKAVKDQSSTILGVPAGSLKAVIGAGDSQSAFRLLTYVNAFQNANTVYDGYLINSRFDYGAPISGLGASNGISDALVRTDLGVPVFQLETETDLAEGFVGARQPDTSTLRTWEVAGATHVGMDGLEITEPEVGEATGQQVTLTPTGIQSYLGCSEPISSFPLHVMVDTVVHDLAAWVVSGTPPPTAQQITTNGTALVLDSYGNVEGGLRISDIAVPTATYQALGSPAACTSAGGEVPFTASQLAQLYPTHQAYVSAVLMSAFENLVAGYLQPVDALTEYLIAEQSSIGS